MEFPRNRCRADGHASRCRSCHAIKQRELDRGERAPRSFAPTREPEPWELPWAAGFLEGDGSFGERSDRGAVRVRADQVNPEPLERLQEIFGGSLSSRGKRTTAGNVVWRWGVAGERAEIVCDALYPYLSGEKREQINSTDRRQVA